LIHEILPVKEIIDRMVREARTILQSIGNLLPVEDGKM
jgi:hypothetical protein